MSIAVQDPLQVKLLTDVLCQCIGASRAAAQLPEQTRRTVIEPLVQQHLRTGTLDLDGLWQDLLREPGVTERGLASAFAAMEDLEKVVQIPLRPVQRLQVLNDAQRQRLLGECPVNREAIEKLVRRARIEAQLGPMKVSRPGTLAALRTSSANLQPPVQGSAGASKAPAGSATSDTPSAAPASVSASPVPQPRISLSSSPGISPASLNSSPRSTPAAAPTGSSGAGLTQALSIVPAAEPLDPAEAAAREARVKAARALLSQANAEMMADAKRSRPGNLQAPPVKGGPSGLRQRPVKEPPKKKSNPVVAALVALLGLSAIGVTGYFTVYKDLPKEVDVSRYPALQLREAKQVDQSVQGVLVDPRWKGMTLESRRAAAAELFRQLKPRGIHSLVLLDAQSLMQAQVNDEMPEPGSKDGLTVLLPNTPPPGATPPAATAPPQHTPTPPPLQRPPPPAPRPGKHR